MPQSLHIRVSLAGQTLELRDGDRVLKRYPVSTSKYGPGNQEGSFRTPLGSFRICEKHGAGESLHTIFRSRRPVGEWNPEDSCEDDLVLARILRLDGLDPENANSYRRYIYIHGTNHEERIGTPASQGCVRMKNCDVAELFDLVAVGTPVSITGA
ncbi:MAG: L,D-transpeptidase [Akkermansiaceae bacterium]|nr:L,D-transpeptidase [Akkermansiaceae bacterium]